MCNSCSFSAFHFDFTGGKGVGKSSLVRKFLLGEFSEDYRGGSQSKTLFSTFSEVLDNHEVLLVNIILLRHSCSLFLLPLVFWENASLPCVDYYYHGLIVWDGHDPQPVKRPPGIERGGRVIGGAVVVVYDITNPSSFDEAKDLVHRAWLQRHVVGLVGSKADLWMHRKIKYEVLSCYNYIHVKLPWN